MYPRLVSLEKTVQKMKDTILELATLKTKESILNGKSGKGVIDDVLLYVKLMNLSGDCTISKDEIFDAIEKGVNELKNA